MIVAGPHSRRSRRMRRNGPGARARRHSSPRWRSTHVGPYAHQGDPSRGHYTCHGEGAHWTLRRVPGTAPIFPQANRCTPSFGTIHETSQHLTLPLDPRSSSGRLHRRVRSPHPRRSHIPCRQAPFPYALRLRLPQSRRGPPPHQRGSSYDTHKGRSRHRGRG